MKNRTKFIFCVNSLTQKLPFFKPQKLELPRKKPSADPARCEATYRRAFQTPKGLCKIHDLVTKRKKK